MHAFTTSTNPYFMKCDTKIEITICERKLTTPGDETLESELNQMKAKEQEWSKCIQVNKNTIQSLHSKIVVINKLTDELHFERQRNKNLVIESDQCLADLGQCQSDYNSTEDKRIDCETNRQDKTSTITERDNLINGLREQLTNSEVRVGNCEQQSTSLRDELSKSKNAHQLAEQQLTTLQSTNEALDKELTDCKNRPIQSDKQTADNPDNSLKTIENTNDLADCERKLNRSEYSLEMVKESYKELTIQNHKAIEERGGLKFQIEQFTKQVEQCTENLDACVNKN